MMEEKEMNKQILSQLYQVADHIICRLPLKPGAYTANELEKKNNKEGLFAGFECEDREVHVNVGTFSCKLDISTIFYYIAKFETLAGITGTKKHIFVIVPENNHYLSKVVVKISCADLSLCEHLNENSVYTVYRNVCLDIAAKEFCASEGHTVEIKKLHVVDASEYDPAHTRPVIDRLTFAKMCKRAGKKGAELVCKLVKNAGNRTVWESVCCGYVSRVEEYKGVPYHSVFPKVDPLRKVEMDAATWKQARKWIKANFAFFGADEKAVIIEHEKNDQFLKLAFKSSSVFVSALFPCLTLPSDAFAISFKAETLATALDQFCLYLPSSSERAGIFVNSDNIQLRMPLLEPGNVSYSLPTENYNMSIFDLVNLDKEVAIIEPRKNHRKTTVKKVQAVKAGTSKNKVDPEMSKKTATKVQPSCKRASTSSKVEHQATNDGKKFTFDKIGLSVGMTIQFIDGTDVKVAENNMIEFCGELFTLSGFTRLFVPRDKANKSGAYRGCAFFFYQGIRLDKLLKAALSAKVDPVATMVEDTEKMENVEKVEDVKTATIELKNEPTGEEKQTTKEVAVIIQVKPFTAQNADKIAVFPPIRPVATYHCQDVLSVSQGRYMAGVDNVAVMADIRSRGGVAGASCKTVDAVGTVAPVGYKVVHEYPLPPPCGDIAAFPSL